MVIPMEIIFALDEIETIAQNFLQIVKPNKVFAFSGDLGAGKTTFINALCKQLGVTESVTSPTYSIIQEYAGADRDIIYHIDLYRLKSDREAMDAGVEDSINSGEICMIEWPERAPSIFPDKTVYATFEILSDHKRKLVVQLP
jgi:tRNA threonylcarbamoyladenosine biosynthesis protein TsaE